MDGRVIRALDAMNEAAIIRELGWDAFLRYKAASYQRQNGRFRQRFTLLAYLGMTAEEYGEWVAYDKVSDRVKRVWT